MPVRPETRDRYPADWAAISLAIKERAGWRCECLGECGRGTHDGRCPNRHGQAAYGTGSKVVLTTAHSDHTPENVDPSKVRADFAKVAIFTTTATTTLRRGPRPGRADWQPC